MLQQLGNSIRKCESFVEETTHIIEEILHPKRPSDVPKMLQQTKCTKSKDISKLNSDTNNATRNYEFAQIDQVFEAYVSKTQTCNSQDKSNSSGKVFDLEKDKISKEKKDTGIVLQELKNVLVSKRKEWEIREANALARKDAKSVSDKTAEMSVKDAKKDNIDGHSCDRKSTEIKGDMCLIRTEQYGPHLLENNKNNISVEYYRNNDQELTENLIDISSNNPKHRKDLLGKNLFKKPLRPAALKNTSSFRSKGLQERKTEINVQSIRFEKRYLCINVTISFISIHFSAFLYLI